VTELRLEEVPGPPLFVLEGPDGRPVFQERPVGGEPARVGAVFSSVGVAREFSREAGSLGMGSFFGLEPRELAGWEEVRDYASSGPDYVLVLSEAGAGLFHAEDLAAHACARAGELPLPLYVYASEGGGSPLVRVEHGGEELLVAPLFTSPGRAGAFRERARHLDLPEGLGSVRDREGLRRHALLAREAGARYVVLDPGEGPSRALPVEELIRRAGPPGML